jgi:hypothetical protein
MQSARKQVFCILFSRAQSEVCALLFLLLAAWSAPLFPQEDSAKDATVWALDDTDKVHPITGNLLSEGAEIYNGRPLPPTAW